MKINPINSINNTSYKANIKPTKSLKESFDMMENCVQTGTMKNLNSAKDFLDSLVRIRESKKVQDFKIEIDKRRAEHTYTNINGRRVSGGHNENLPNIQDNYLAVEGIKRYASKLEKIQTSYLDNLKSQIEQVDSLLDTLKDRYAYQIKAELEEAKKMIFKDAQ